MEDLGLVYVGAFGSKFLLMDFIELRMKFSNMILALRINGSLDSEILWRSWWVKHLVEGFWGSGSGSFLSMSTWGSIVVLRGGVIGVPLTFHLI